MVCSYDTTNANEKKEDRKKEWINEWNLKKMLIIQSNAKERKKERKKERIIVEKLTEGYKINACFLYIIQTMQKRLNEWMKKKRKLFFRYDTNQCKNK